MNIENEEKDNITQPILVAYAEDHHLVRETVVKFLEELGGLKVIIQAENGKEVIRKIEAAAIKPDVCILDIVMPEMNGFDTVTKIKSLWKEIKILVLSGYLSEEYLVKMFLAGADGYLTKKVHPNEIKKAIVDIYHYGISNTEHFSQEFIRKMRKKEKYAIVLSEKEIQLLKLSIEDKTFEEIAALMNLTSRSIEGNRKRLYEKIGVKSRTGLVKYAVKNGYVTFD